MQKLIAARWSARATSIVTESLFTALQKASEAGDVEGTIKLSRFILKLLNKVPDDLVYLFPESEKKGSQDPV